MKKIFTYLILFLIIANCGFKVVNQLKINNYKISEVETFGNKKINFKIKNRLLLSSENDAAKIIKVRLNTKIEKVTKEKNIKNEITKKQLTISTKVNILDESNSNLKNFTIYKNGDYNVDQKYSNTLNNERKLIEILTESITNKIIQEISNKLNDF